MSKLENTRSPTSTRPAVTPPPMAAGMLTEPDTSN